MGDEKTYQEDGERVYRKGSSSLPWPGVPARYEFGGFRVVEWWFAWKFGNSFEVEVLHIFLLQHYESKSEPGVPIEVKNYDAELALFKSLYPNSTEDRDPNTIPSTKTGIVLTLYVDATWASELNRHSITGYIIYFGSTPITWYSGKQSQVEGSTYASEFCALRKSLSSSTNLLNVNQRISKI